MSKVITFSRQFQKSHPRDGGQTYFVQKILNKIGIDYKSPEYLQLLLMLNTKKIFEGKLSYVDLVSFQQSLDETTDDKNHTIRGSKRFNAGEIFTPVVWKGKPYTQCQIIFAPDIEIKKIFDIYIFMNWSVMINGKHFQEFELLAKNDGLAWLDFFHWFDVSKEIFDGQIICWNENVNY